jgi:hypothetical protein
MTTLINPANGLPAEFVRSERGYIALDTTQITRAIRWFPLSAIEAANPPATCAEPVLVYTCEPPPHREIVVFMPPDMLKAINYSSGVCFITRPAA